MRLVITLCMVAVIWLVPEVTFAQHCNPEVKTHANHPHRYQSRGILEDKSDRCEGIFIKKLSSTSLNVVSFTKYFEDFSSDVNEDMQVSWPQEIQLPIQLYSIGIKFKMFYRMDSVRPSGESRFTWPMNVLNAYRIRRADIGVLAWTDSTIAGESVRIHLPISIQQADQEAAKEEYRAVLLSSKALKHVFIRISDDEGTVVENDTLKLGPYPANRAIIVDLSNYFSDLHANESYKLSFSAIDRQDKPLAAKVFHFYYF